MIYKCCRNISRYREPDYNNAKCSGGMRDSYLKDMVIIDNFLTDEECDYIIKLSESKLKPSTVMGKEGDEKTDYRTSEQIFMSRHSDPVLKSISDRVSRQIGIAPEYQESIQILRYKEGKYYKPHYDACLDDTANCIRDRRLRGVRVNTALMYLSNVEKGGETSFNNIPKAIKPKKGTAIFFTPTYRDSAGSYQHHPCSYHEALKPERGTKWSLTVWTRDKFN